MSPTSLEQLAIFKTQNPRASQEFLDKASPLLKDIKHTKANDDSMYSGRLQAGFVTARNSLADN